jgi:hypothetical protein
VTRPPAGYQSGLVLLAAAACGSVSQSPAGAQLGPAIAAAIAAAEAARAPWRCAAVDGPTGPDETLIAGDHAWRLSGRTLTLVAPGDLAIGVLADAGGSGSATLAALGRLRAQLGHIDLMITLGGMAGSQAGLEAVLGALTDPAWPLVALPGDLEPIPVHSEAIAAARRRGAGVVDGRLVHRIELGGATLALVPGVAVASRLVSGQDGCTYQPSDVAAAYAELAPRPGLRVLVSGEPARRAEASDPTGELALAPSTAQLVDVLLYGPWGDGVSPPRTGRRNGAAAPLTPGSSDTIARPGLRRPASAGVFTIRGTAWAWRPIQDVR